MKRKTLLFLLLFALMAPWAAQAQTVTIGTGTSTDYYTPIGCYHNYSFTEQLYAASEINQTGYILSIGFSYSGSVFNKDFPIVVYMKAVDDTDLSSGWISVTGSDVVFDGTLSVTDAGWASILLDNPFNYDGTKNLLIAIDKERLQWYSNGSWNHTSSTSMTRYYCSDGTNMGIGDLSTYTGSVTNNRPNVQLTFGTPPTCLPPTLGTTVNTSEDNAYFQWTPNGSESHWRLEYSTSSNFSSFLYKDFNAPFGSITDLLPGTTYYARVRALCGDGDVSNPSNVVSFTTECGAIITFPWTESFESYAAGDFSNPCWVNEHISGSGTNLFKVYTSSMGGNSTHQLQLPDMAIGTLTKLVLPEMSLPNNNYLFAIDIYRSTSTYNDYYPNEGIRVYASTNGEIEGARELAFIPRHFAVSNDVIPAESEEGYYTYELPIGMSGTCYIILRGESQYCTATYMDNFTVKEAPSCIRPTGLVASNPYAHGATLKWTVNDATQTTWEAEVATDEEFTENVQPYPNINTNENYPLSRLDPETTYYVRVRANCGGGDVSEWSNTAHFTTLVACPAPTGLEVTPGNYSAVLNWNGTSNSYTVSYRTAAYADGIVEEFNTSGIPAGWERCSGLVDNVIAGDATLSSVGSGWYTTSNALGQYNMKLNIWGNSTKYWLVTPEFNLSQNLSFDLALTAYNSENPIANDTLQSDDRFAVLIYANETWTILREWNNSGSEYVYNAISATGENVTIDLSAYYGQDVKIAFYGESTNPSDMANTGGDNDLHIDNVICGIPYDAGAWQTIPAADTTAILTDLTPLTAYEVKVQGDCGEEGPSLETDIISFTTLEDCPIPQNVEVDDITSNSASVSWEGYNDSYVVSYRTAAYVDGVIEHFDVLGVPSGWTRYTGLVDYVLTDSIQLAPATGGWATTSYALGEYNMKLNIYGASYVKHWLVTPEFKPSQDLTFDLALTDYNNSDPIENDTLQADDRFIVLVYADDAWHILREWNNSGSEYVYNTISATGENVTINLSAYYGKKVKIAFYGESTSSSDENAGDNDLHIDNIVCGTPVEAGEWETVEATESPIVLTDLTPETPYEVKVQGICDGEPTEETEIVTFTTLEQTTVTQTITLTEGWNWISLYVEVVDPIAMLQQLEEALGDNATMISATEIYTEYLGDGLWIGDLDDEGVYNEQMYMIEAVADCEIELEGTLANAENYTIDINPGWNWIGFPHSEELLLEDALINFAAEEEDQFAEADIYSEYGFGMWIGDIETLVPGHGYMYFYNGEETTPLVYNTFAKARKAGLKAIEKKTDKVTFNRNSIKKMK